MFLDSQSAIHLCKNPIYHERTKHIDIRYHFVRDLVANGIVKIQKIPTEDNLADMGTKVQVTTSKFKYCLNLLHVKIG